MYNPYKDSVDFELFWLKALITPIDRRGLPLAALSFSCRQIEAISIGQGPAVCVNIGITLDH